MIRVDLQHGGKVRIWNEDLDFVNITDVPAARQTYVLSSEIVNFTMPDSGHVVAEIFLPRGGRNIYGLLGLKYEKTDNKELEVLVPESDIDSKNIFMDSLISEFDFALVGLQGEYSKYVINALNEINEKNGFKFSGRINFCYAAFSEVSSNGWVFQKLTSILIRLAGKNLNAVTREMIEDEIV